MGWQIGPSEAGGKGMQALRKSRGKTGSLLTHASVVKGFILFLNK